MKKLMMIAGVATLMLAACQTKQEGYTIQGTLTGDAPRGKAYLERSDYRSQPVVIDSAEVVDGKFSFTGKVESPALHYVIIDLNQPGDQPDLRNRKFRTLLYLDNSEITYTGDVATLPGFYYATQRKTKAPAISGSPTHDLFLSMNKAQKEVNDTLGILNERYMKEFLIPESEGKEADPAVGTAIAREELKWKEELTRRQLEFIKGNAASVVALDQAVFLLTNMETALTSAQINEMVNWFKQPWAGTPQFTFLEETAQAAIPTAIGEKYKDVDVLDAEGKTVKLSTMIPEGEYVMLEFWASWCGPCRAEIPHLRRVHEKYKDFAIVSISLDEKEADWRKAMKEENMNWTQGRIEGGFTGASAKEYNIIAIPRCMILDKEGRIHKINMRGSYLDVFLEDIYGKR